MKKTERVSIIKGLVSSIEENLMEREEVEEKGEKPYAGYNIGSGNSVSAIKNRCVIARAELMNIIHDLEG